VKIAWIGESGGLRRESPCWEAKPAAVVRGTVGGTGSLARRGSHHSRRASEGLNRDDRPETESRPVPVWARGSSLVLGMFLRPFKDAGRRYGAGQSPVALETLP